MAKAKPLSKYMDWVYPGHQNATFFEFLVQLEQVPELEQKVKQLQTFARRSPTQTYAVGMFFEAMLNPKLEWGIPVGDPPPYRCADKHPDRCPAGLATQSKKLKYFLRQSDMFIANVLKREKVFLQTLESMCEGDAALLVAMRNRDWSVMPGITAEVLAQAFPNWVRPGYSTITAAVSNGVTADSKKDLVGGKKSKKKHKKKKKKSSAGLDVGSIDAASSGVPTAADAPGSMTVSTTSSIGKNAPV